MKHDIRVVITTKCSVRHQLFLSRACELFGENIVGVFFQQHEPTVKKTSKVAIKETVSDFIPQHIKQTIRGILRTNPKAANYEEELKVLFEYTAVDYWKHLNAPVFWTPKVNSDETLQKLRDCKPDLILVFGGTILKEDWIHCPRLGTINLHTGILPYYRSCNSNTYALYHENFHLVGSTVHYIDKGVDTGSSITRHHVDPTHFQCFEKLRARVFFDGLNGLLDAASTSIKTNKKLPSVEEVSKDSYYPHAVYSPFIGDVATHRLKSHFNTPWPIYPRIQERPDISALKKNSPESIVNGIYILLYHGIYDPSNIQDWESNFLRIQTSKSDFNEQLAYISQFASPVRLSEVPGLLRKGPVNKPYYVVTFDDGYNTLQTHARSICEKHDVSPTIFACSDFASGKKVNFRILLSLLVDGGYSGQIRDQLNSELNIKIPEQQSILDFCKDFYQYQVMNNVVHKIWQEIYGDLPDIHLDWSSLKELQKTGWEIGNHTKSHCILGKLNYEQHIYEINENVKAFNAAGLKYINWLSYPFGASKHVNQETYRWLLDNNEWNGIFAKGGVNTFYSKTEWLRIGIGPDNLSTFKQKLNH